MILKDNMIYLKMNTTAKLLMFRIPAGISWAMKLSSLKMSLPVIPKADTVWAVLPVWMLYRLLSEYWEYIKAMK